MEINLNERVKVKLTDIGIKELQRQHDDLLAKYPNLKLTPHTTIVDENGYTEFQLHSLISSLGHLVYIGADVPFEPTMIYLCTGDVEVNHDN